MKIRKGEPQLHRLGVSYGLQSSIRYIKPIIDKYRSLITANGPVSDSQLYNEAIKYEINNNSNIQIGDWIYVFPTEILSNDFFNPFWADEDSEDEEDTADPEDNYGFGLGRISASLVNNNKKIKTIIRDGEEGILLINFQIGLKKD